MKLGIAKVFVGDNEGTMEEIGTCSSVNVNHGVKGGVLTKKEWRYIADKYGKRYAKEHYSILKNS